MVGKNCRYCDNQKIVNNNHVKEVNGELKRVCPICYASL